MFMGLVGKHPVFMGSLRGLVELYKTGYGMFSARAKDNEREEQA